MPNIKLNGEMKEVTSDELLSLERLGIEFESPGVTGYIADFPVLTSKRFTETDEEYEERRDEFRASKPRVVPVTNLHMVKLKYGRDFDLRWDKVDAEMHTGIIRRPFFASIADAETHIRNKQAFAAAVRPHNQRIKRAEEELEKLRTEKRVAERAQTEKDEPVAYADIPQFKSDKPGGYSYSRKRDFERKTGGKETLTPITDE